MSADWIKMRIDIYTHPRFLSLCSLLMYHNDRPGMLVYACGEDALRIGAIPQSNETVTERALRCVTESALRDVTLCATLRVWSAVNAHCKVVENDAIMSPMSLLDLDRIAGFEGFAESLRDVGWVREIDPITLIFDNFLEFNQPACLRITPKTNAERQAEYRARKQAEKEGVTKVTKSNGRAEQIRLDLKAAAAREPPPVDNSAGKPLNGHNAAALLPLPASENLKPNGNGDPTEWAHHLGSLGVVSAKGGPLTATNETMLGWIRDNTALAVVIESVNVARESNRKPGTQKIRVTYLVPIVRDLQTQRPARSTTAWWTTEKRTIAKGKSLGLEARAGEEIHEFRERIKAKLSQNGN
jgi:hypothetical protein